MSMTREKRMEKKIYNVQNSRKQIIYVFKLNASRALEF